MKEIIFLLIMLQSLIMFGEEKKIGFGEGNYKKEIGFEKQKKREEENRKLEEMKVQQEQMAKENLMIKTVLQENALESKDNQLFVDDKVSNSPRTVRNVERPELITNNVNFDWKLINYIKTQNRQISESEIRRILRAVFGYSKQYNINPYLVLAIMNTESHFKHSTVSFAGARGLMQLMSFNFREFGVDNSIEGNIKGGVMHLRRDFNRTGDVVKTLVCYNAGCGKLANDAWKRIKETREYIPKVIRNYNKIINL